MEITYCRILDVPEKRDAAAKWFSEKWNIPREAYEESIEEALKGIAPVPQWYLALDHDRIVGGLGVIPNDFHPRKDLSPNVCAVYTEEDIAKQGDRGPAFGTGVRGYGEKGNHNAVPSYGSHFLL